MSKRHKTVIITGGIVSGIGKGITAASIGRLLINSGYTVAPVKVDPYLNRDAGTMNPFQHGEVFVTEDGSETDLDLGHYERFLDVNATQYANFTSGAVYHSVMEYEREGDFLGKTIQIIPHVTNEISRRVLKAAEEAGTDFLTVEIGGTVGDYEALPFIEAMRQYRADRKEDTIVVHVVKMDYLYPSDEGKTKPIQHAVTTLRGFGLQPDILIVRCKRPLTEDEKEKISLFTGVAETHVIPAPDAASLYDIPGTLEANGLTKAVLDKFHLKPRTNETSAKATVAWMNAVKLEHECKMPVRVGLVGKYVEHSDAYLSVIEAVRHAGLHLKAKTEIVPINAEDGDIAEQIRSVDAVIVPGGFGSRGVEGKIEAIHAVRTEKVPFLGICLGLQTAVIEYVRDCAKKPQATSTEFEPDTKEPVIAYLPGQETIRRKGGTMRLGSYPAVLTKGSLVENLYKTFRPDEIEPNSTIHERHRHRYEVNPAYHDTLTACGMVLSGMSPDGTLVEFIELPESVHPYFVGTQAHPEFRSRPTRPHPLFAGLIAAAINRSASKEK